MQNSLFNTNFLGKDGNPFWIGQVAPQTPDSNGWGNRIQVRILGYHPANETELPNNDLPYAQCLLPTTSGSGGGQVSGTVKVNSGDTVFGCFLDGEAGQYPIIIGSFGRTSQVSVSDYNGPFVPFTGFNSSFVENGRVFPNQANEKGDPNTQSTPRDLSPDGISKINQQLAAAGEPEKERNSYAGIGKKIVFADSCKDSTIKGISSVIYNLLSAVSNGLSFIASIPEAISMAVDKIAGLANRLVGQMFNYLYKELIGLMQKGLDALYASVFASVFSKTASEPKAHAAGVAAQLAMAKPVSAVEQALSCVASKIVNGLKETVKELLESVVENVANFVTCAAEQFVGAFLNKVIDDIENGLKGVLGAVDKILSPVFTVSDFLRNGSNLTAGVFATFQAIGGFLDCNQEDSKCSNTVKEWVIGAGAIESEDENNVVVKILNGMNTAQGIAKSFTDNIEKKFDEWDIFNTKDGKEVSPYGGCYTGEPRNCGPPSVRIFGGGGVGAVGKAVLGSFVKNTSGLSQIVDSVSYTASVVGVKIENPGKGYKYPPFVEFVDSCGRGYGAVGRALINENGEVTSIYMVSTGENFTVTSIEDEESLKKTNYSVNKVEVIESGYNYSPNDVAKDTAGNTYKIKVSNGRIIEVIPDTLINTPVTYLPIVTVKSSTGFGAILKPILGDYRPPQGEVIKVIDCIK